MNYQQYFIDEIIDADDSEVTCTRNLRDRSVAKKKEDLTRDSVIDRRLRKLVDGVKFLSDFDPEKSTRERRKLTRKCYTQSSSSRSNAVFDDKGRYRLHQADVCDCLDDDCPGCHFPCPSCKNTKCGTNCRVNRKWAFECIEHDGKDLVVKNKYIENK